MFYEQLLRAQIPKAQKKIDNLTVFFALLGSALVKAALRTLMKLTPNYKNSKKLIVKLHNPNFLVEPRSRSFLITTIFGNNIFFSC